MLLKDLSALASPLNDQQIGQLQQAAAELSPQQLAWISGYFWGLSQTSAPQGAHQQPLAQAVATAAKPAGKLTIIYASQTGNAKGVASELHAQASALGIEVKLYSAEDYKPRDLAKETHVVIVASTNGEGEPPDNAIGLHEFLQSKKAPKLPNLQYAVLGLGIPAMNFSVKPAKILMPFCQSLVQRRFANALIAMWTTSKLPMIGKANCLIKSKMPSAAHKMRWLCHFMHRQRQAQ